MLRKTKTPSTNLTMLNFSCKKGCMKLCFLGNVVVLLVQLCHYKTANFRNLNTSSSTVMGTFKSHLGKQLNTCWSFISPEYVVENLLGWITKIEPELMMEVSLVLAVRQLHDGQNHLLSESKISGFKNLEKEEPILGDNGIVKFSHCFHLHIFINLQCYQT